MRRRFTALPLKNLAMFYLVPLDIRHSVRRQDDVHDVVDQPVLEDPVRHCGGAEAGGGVDLNEPRLEVVVDDDVVAVALVAVSVRDHDGGHRLQTVNYQPVDLIEQFLAGGLAPGHLQVEPQVLHGHLAAVDVVVVPPVLLYGDIGEVDKEVVHLPHTVVVPHCAEPAEAELEEVHLQQGVHLIFIIIIL